MAPKHTQILERSEAQPKWTPPELPALATHSLGDMRILNRQGTPNDTALDEFGTLELIDDGDSNAPPPGQTDTVDPAVDRPASTQDKPEYPRDPELIAAEEQLQATADSYGLSVEALHNQHGEIEYRYFLPADGVQERRNILSTTDSTPETQLDRIRQEQIATIEETYTVNINPAGQIVRFRGNDQTSREPTFHELANLDTALLHGQPSQLNGDGSIMDVNFLDSFDNFGGGFYRDNSINLVDISSDNSRAQKVIEHELGHHAHDDLRSNVKEGERYLDEHYERQGWVRNDDGDFLVQREDGALFLRVEDSFVRADLHGQFLDANGVVVPQLQAETLTDQQMQETARVPHVHEGFPPNPGEHNAEVQAYFRHSREFRAIIYQTSPELYAAQRRFDQDQINRFYGTDNGVSRFIRSPDGLMVPNTPENRAEVNAFESELPHLPPVTTGRNLPPLKDFETN